jgi:hypothetical protein
MALIGRLNPACSVLRGLLMMAEIAPDLISFLAISLASLASMGLFCGGALSGSGRGAFKACNAFFCK